MTLCRHFRISKKKKKDETKVETILFFLLIYFECVFFIFSNHSDEVGTPSAPALVADSLTATSLSLEWEIPDRLARLTKGKGHITKNYLVQWRYEEVAADWTFCRNQSMGYNSTIRVDNLQPFTKYRVNEYYKYQLTPNQFNNNLTSHFFFFFQNTQFRVALILSSNTEMELFSEQSLIISTLAQGTPLSKPVIVRAVAVDHSRISISWGPGPFPNGPIIFYVLQIKDTKRDGYLALKVYFRDLVLLYTTKFFLFLTLEIQNFLLSLHNL